MDDRQAIALLVSLLLLQVLHICKELKAPNR